MLHTFGLLHDTIVKRTTLGHRLSRSLPLFRAGELITIKLFNIVKSKNKKAAIYNKIKWVFSVQRSEFCRKTTNLVDLIVQLCL